MSEEKTATITIQIEQGKKQRMEEFFEELGLSLPYGVSIFFEQCIICAGLPQEIVDRDDQDDFIEDWQDGPKTEQIIVPITPYKKRQVEYVLREEGCLSLDGVRKTTRYQNISVEYRDGTWKKRQQNYTGWIAQIIQHEMDHLEGIII